jgi:hypothetical protein
MRVPALLPLAQGERSEAQLQPAILKPDVGTSSYPLL